MIKVHHLNCGTLCPFAVSWITGGSKKMVCHCLLIETNSGLILVDTGFGTDDIRFPEKRLGKSISLINPRFDQKETALSQILNLGFKREDVRHIVLTHLDLDHAGGISDFPEATVHLYRPELNSAQAPEKGFVARHRYRETQWNHGPHWQPHDLSGENWMEFEAVRQLKGLPPEILLVPLLGHTSGHCGIAVQTGESWLFHAGDSYFSHQEVDLDQPSCSPLLSIFQKTMAVDNSARLKNQDRIRSLIRDKKEMSVFCAHDELEYLKFTSKPRET